MRSEAVWNSRAADYTSPWISVPILLSTLRSYIVTGSVKSIFNILLISVHSFDPWKHICLMNLYNSFRNHHLKRSVPIKFTLAEIILMIHCKMRWRGCRNMMVIFNHQLSFHHSISVASISSHYLQTIVLVFEVAADHRLATSFDVWIWWEDFSKDFIVWT